jgi:hypothetical protein
MNKLTNIQPPRIYAFIYEFGKNLEGRFAFAREVTTFLDDYENLTLKMLGEKYPEFKLGEQAREAKEKVENLKTKKRTK